MDCFSLGGMVAEVTIQLLHVEASSRCNAWCPACSRNKNGYELTDDLIEQDLDINRFQQVLSELGHLNIIQFCGNYGDPIIAKNILDLIELAKKHCNKIQIHTNGSLRNKEWWTKLAQQLSSHDHDIWFGLDGLGATHEIYRQGTSYNKIIENAHAFIQAGGQATWQFIPFEHNESQVIDCLRLSQQMGFRSFKLVKLFRNKKTVYHYRTKKPFELRPPKELSHLIRISGLNDYVNESDCMHLNPEPSIYLNAQGSISRCCYLDNIIKFDTVQEMFSNKLDLTHQQCLISCGSKYEN